VTRAAHRPAAQAVHEGEQRLRLRLQCPACAHPLGEVDYAAPLLFERTFRCEECSFVLTSEQGIWKALPAGRQWYFERFLMGYQIVRAAEGGGGDQAAYYLELPYKDLSGRKQWQWAIRARTFRSIVETVLPQLERKASGPLVVLDLGAGNSWVSYPRAEQGYRLVAVDLLTDHRNGLGAACHYLQELPVLFPRFQAEMDRLPFGGSQFDVAIFNASFHYSENYVRTLGEAIRCLRPGASVIIADSPFYQHEESGEHMVEERRVAFSSQFSFPSDSLLSLECLTADRLMALEARFRIHWQTVEPRYGLRWAMRPWIAKWKGKREASKFRIYRAVVSTDDSPI
jgi:SAM-dependent methyltransferase